MVTFDDAVPTDGSRGQVGGNITCEAGALFVLELDLTQGAATAEGNARGSCTGSTQAFAIGFVTAGSGFSDGPAQACVAGRTGQPGSRAVIDSTEVCEEVTVGVSSQAARSRCISELVRAGVIGPDGDPGSANIVVGTEGHDDFEPRAPAKGN